MTPALSKASTKAHVLDEATQTLIKEQQRKDQRFRTWCYTSLFIILVLGVAGVYRQNQIATQNKNHIDCIVKLFTSTNRSDKIITDAEGACNIKTAPTS